MNKIRLLILICLFLLVSTNAFALTLTINGEQKEYTGPNVTLILNEEPFVPQEGQMPAIVLDSRTLVPLREVFETLGASVSWDASSKSISISLDNTNIELAIDSKVAIVNGVSEEIDVSPKIINNKTMVPVRFISEKANFHVDWDAKTSTVKIIRSLSAIPDVQEPSEELIEIDPDEEDTEHIVIPDNISISAKTFNNKFSKYFGDSKTKNATYQLCDLIITNNATVSDHSLLVKLRDENEQYISSDTITELYEIKSNIIKYPFCKYDISGRYGEDGYLYSVVIKRVLQ